MRFLGLGLGDRIPDARTIWLFRERLTKAGAIKALFERFYRVLRGAGYIAMSGQIVFSGDYCSGAYRDETKHLMAVPKDAYSTLTASARPSSCRTCRSSLTSPLEESAETVTENSTPILSSEPERSFGRIFVPRRFQTSGGTAPVTRSVRDEVGGWGSGSSVGPGSGAGGVTRPGSGPGLVVGVTGLPALSASAALFLNRNTPASKATSSDPRSGRRYRRCHVGDCSDRTLGRRRP